MAKTDPEIDLRDESDYVDVLRHVSFPHAVDYEQIGRMIVGALLERHASELQKPARLRVLEGELSYRMKVAVEFPTDNGDYDRPQSMDPVPLPPDPDLDPIIRLLCKCITIDGQTCCTSPLCVG